MLSPVNLHILFQQNLIHTDQAVIALHDLRHLVHHLLDAVDNRVKNRQEQHNGADCDGTLGSQIGGAAQAYQLEALRHPVDRAVQAQLIPVVMDRRCLYVPDLGGKILIFGLLKAVGAGQIIHLQHFLEGRVRVLCLVPQNDLVPLNRPHEPAQNKDIERNHDSEKQQHDRHLAQRDDNHEDQVNAQMQHILHLLMHQQFDELYVGNQLGEQLSAGRVHVILHGQCLQLLHNAHLEAGLHLSDKALIEPAVQPGTDQIQRQRNRRAEYIEKYRPHKESLVCCYRVDDIGGVDRQQQCRRVFDRPVQDRQNDKEAVISKQVLHNAEMVFLCLLIRLFVIGIDLLPQIAVIAMLRINPVTVHTAPVTVIDVEAVLIQNPAVDLRLDLLLLRVRRKAVKRIRRASYLHFRNRPASFPHIDGDLRIVGL